MTDFRRRFLQIQTPKGAVEVALVDFGDPQRPVDVVFSHGNGFNAMTHRQALSPLGSELRIIAVDQRGHGRTRAPADPAGRDDWFDLVDDLAAVVQALDPDRPLVLAGHSMGATISLLAADRLGRCVKSLVLFDPVIAPAMRRPDEPHPQSLLDLASMTMRRRTVFKDRAEAVDSYRGRGIFSAWPDQALRDFAEDGFTDADGKVRLACSPDWEASNYLAQRHPAMERLTQSERPTCVFRAGVGSTCAAMPDDPTVRRNRLVRIKTVEGTSHLLPVERPDIVQAALREAIRDPSPK